MNGDNKTNGKESESDYKYDKITRESSSSECFVTSSYKLFLILFLENEVSERSFNSTT